MKPGVSERQKEEQAKEKACGELESPSHTTPLTQTHNARPYVYNSNEIEGSKSGRDNVQKSIRERGVRVPFQLAEPKLTSLPLCNGRGRAR